MVYVIQKTDSSFCSDCGCNVHLLCPRWGSTQENTTTAVAGGRLLDIAFYTEDGRLLDTAFYICFKCKKVSQVGVGEVTRDDVDIN